MVHTRADAEPASESATDASRRWLTALVLAIVLGAGAGRVLTSNTTYTADRWPDKQPADLPFFSANDRSRWVTVWSLVERGTYRIDEIIAVNGWDTIDKVRLGDHFYSSKPPLLSTLVAGIYWVVKRLTGWSLETNPHAVARTILLLINVIPWCAAVGMLGRLGARYARTDAAYWIVLLTAAFATFVTPFLVTLNNHTPAVCCLVFSLVPLLRVTIDGSRRWTDFAQIGFWAAATVTNELPAAAFGMTTFVLLMRCDVRRTLVAYAPAAAIPLAAFFVTNWIVTGGLKPAYAQFGTGAYNYVHEGIPSHWVQPTGIDASQEPAWLYLLHCTFGHRGIFTLTPMYLLTLWSWCRPGDWRRSRLGVVYWMSLGLTIWVLAFYLAQTSSYNYGGNSSGLRWTFWLIPLWLVALIPVTDAFAGRPLFRGVVAVLLGISVFSVTWPERNPWQKPWLQLVFERWGVVDYDRLGVAPVPSGHLRTWIASLPVREPFGRGAWIELTGPDRGTPVRLELEETADSFARIAVLEGDREQSITVDPARLAAGAFPKEFAPAADQAAVRFLQGLPYRAEYRPGPVRYVKSAARPGLAFACRLYVAHVRSPGSSATSGLSYRRAVWVSPDVPFGVVQLEDTVRDLADNTILYRQRLTLSAASTILPPAESGAATP